MMGVVEEECGRASGYTITITFYPHFSRHRTFLEWTCVLSKLKVGLHPKSVPQVAANGPECICGELSINNHPGSLR